MASEADVRRIALALPQVTEKPFYGSPGFRVADRLFLRIRDEEEGGLLAFLPDPALKDVLLAEEPDRFFTTPHYDGHPSVLVRIEAVDVERLEEIVVDAWLARAPARVRAAHEHQLPGP